MQDSACSWVDQSFTCDSDACTNTCVANVKLWTGLENIPGVAAVQDDSWVRCTATAWYINFVASRLTANSTVLKNWVGDFNTLV